MISLTNTIKEIIYKKFNYITISMETKDKKEPTGYQRLAIMLTKDLRRKKIHKLTMLAKARNKSKKQ